MSIVRFLFIASLFLLNHLSARAQDFRQGFIVKQNGDSVPGLIQNRSGKSNYLICYFKPDWKSKEIIKFTPVDLKRYGFVKYKYYESKEITVTEKGKRTKGFFFLEALVKGNANLYRYSTHYYLEKDSLFELPKDSKKQITVGNQIFYKTFSRYKGLLSMALRDCNVSLERIKYEERHLTELIENYNLCKGSLVPVGKSEIPWTKVDFSLFSGTDLSTLGVSAYTWKQKNSVLFGSSLAINSPRVSDKTSLVVEAWYIQKQFVEDYPTSPGGLFDVSFLKIPIGIRFNLLQYSQTPFIEMGLVDFIVLHTSGLPNTNRFFGTLLVRPVYAQGSPVGAWCGVGLTQKIYKKMCISGGVRFEWTTGFLRTENSPAKSINALNFRLGLKF